MDASGAVTVALFPNHDGSQHDEKDPKQCSLRGCVILVASNSIHKMCESCRNRHRIYASTKRTKRNLAKAAKASGVMLDSHSETTPNAVHTSSLKTGQWIVTTAKHLQVGIL